MVGTAAAFILSGILCLQNPVSRPVFNDSHNPVNSRAFSVQEVIFSTDQKHKYVNALKVLGFYKEDYTDEAINIRDATLRFQSDNNLSADGIQGSQFKSAMIKRLTVNGSYVHPDSVAAPPAEGYWITINQTKRILTLYQGKQVKKKFPVAIGKDSSSSPEGKFKVVIKVKDPVWINPETKERVKGGIQKNPLGRRWIGLSAGQGYKYGIHGNNSPYSIGREISKGCIRMINSDVKELYNIIPEGTPVWMGTERTLKKWGVVQNHYF